jgi:glycosyltransferase involved in cell wall biosynthesis
VKRNPASGTRSFRENGARLTVLSVAYPLAPAGPDAVGGAEQILTAIDEALVAAGHRSLVIACRGSRTRGELIELPAFETDRAIAPETVARVHGGVRAATAAALRGHRIDLIHLHGIDFPAYLPPPGPPVLATLHLPPGWYPGEALTPARFRTWLNCVSRSQHAACPRSASLLPPIGNGVSVEALAGARHARRGFALMLARVCPEKGQHLALDAAHAAGVALLIGGEVFPYPAHQEYFASEVQPLLDRHRRFLGPVGLSRKRRLLAAARCVLIPSLAPETSSLVAMEAAAAGTPVIALPNGALAETVEHGRTGFLVQNVRAMTEAIARAGDIDADECRRVARARFSREHMVQRYIEVYRELVGLGRNADLCRRRPGECGEF